MEIGHFFVAGTEGPDEKAYSPPGQEGCLRASTSRSARRRGGGTTDAKPPKMLAKRSLFNRCATRASIRRLRDIRSTAPSARILESLMRAATPPSEAGLYAHLPPSYQGPALRGSGV